VQVQLLGGLSAATQRQLRKLARDPTAAQRSTRAPPRLKPGTRLLRDWHGQTHQVTATEGGFLYQGRARFEPMVCFSKTLKLRSDSNILGPETESSQRLLLTGLPGALER
jgi:DUF2924 family protein